MKRGKFLYTLMFFLLMSVVFIIIFHAGSYTAPDRVNYLNFFINPYNSRFEPGFNFIGIVLDIIGLPAEVSLYLWSYFSFFCALVCIFIYYDRNVFLAISFTILVLFAIYGIMTFIQVRGSGAMWLGVLSYVLYIKSGNKKYLLLLFLTPLIHTMMLPLALLGGLLFFNKLNLKYAFIFVSLLSTVFSVEFLYLAPLIGLDPYYTSYGNDYLNESIGKSPFVLSYLLAFSASLMLSSPKGIHFIALPMVLSAMFSGLDILVKFAMPLILLHWFVLFDSLSLKLGRNEFNWLVFNLVTLLTMPLFLIYPYIRYIGIK